MKNAFFYSVCGILAVCAFISFILYRAADPETADIKISAFPAVIGDWTGRDIPLEKHIYELLETDNLIMRDYTNSLGDTVNLYIIYSGGNRKVSHPPEICLQGDGAAVVDKTYLKISQAITATRLVLEKKDLQDIALYWYKAGPVFTHEYLHQQFKTAIDRLFGKKPSLALIRVITRVKDKDQEAASQKLAQFSLQIEPLLQKYAP